MSTMRTTQTFEVSAEDVKVAVAEFVEKRFGPGGEVRVSVDVETFTTGIGMNEHDEKRMVVKATREPGPDHRPPGLDGGYDPVRDEKKEFALDEFVTLARVEIGHYADTFRGRNDFHAAKHTWRDWFKSFHEYMSW